MSIRSRPWLSAVVLALLTVASVGRADDLLDDVKARAKAEAQRVEKEFADGRAEAYRMVRRDDPRLLESTETLVSLQEMLKRDTSLEMKRRQVLLVTVKWDLDKVKEIAGERRKAQAQLERRILASEARRENGNAGAARSAGSANDTAKMAGSIIDGRTKLLADARGERISKGDRFNRVMGSVDKSALPDSRNYVLPDNWLELSKRRATGIKMTEKEKAIMRALESTIEVDYSKNTFEEVIGHLRKALKVEIATDGPGLREASVNDETPVSLRMRASGRTVLKRFLSDLNLTYVIRDETILITSRERAREMTTVRTYYIGDLVSVVDIRLPAAVTQAMMIDNVNRLIQTLQSRVDPQSWRSNNPDASGAIAFDPVSMSLVVRQTAEVHFLLATR